MQSKSLIRALFIAACLTLGLLLAILLDQRIRGEGLDISRTF